MTDVSTFSCHKRQLTSVYNNTELDGDIPTLNAGDFLNTVQGMNLKARQENWCADYFTGQLYNLVQKNPETAASVGFPREYGNIKKYVETGALDNNVLYNGTIVQKHFKNLEHGPLKKVDALVLHRTNSSTAQSTLNSYQHQTVGAHYLVDTDGTTYQTASLAQKTYHAGKLVQRCKETQTCTEAELKLKGPITIHQEEIKKIYPVRYPANHDSIGIEVVGLFNEDIQKYEPPTSVQYQAVHRLVDALKEKYQLDNGDIYKHGMISAKMETEGAYLGY